MATSFEERGVDAEVVEQPALHVGLEQLPMFVLAVDVDQRFGDRLQCRQRARHAVDESPGSALAGGAPDQAGGVVGSLHGEIVQGFADMGMRAEIELGADVATGRVRPQCGASQAGAEYQRKRIEQDRLAGARFAGDDGQAAPELDVELFDQGEVADGERFQHLDELLGCVVAAAGAGRARGVE